MLLHDSENSMEPEEPEWASETELAQQWSQNFDAGFCSIFNITPPDFESH
jgi:hypothetical protein